MEYISTTALATKLDLKSADLFDKLKTAGFICRKNDKWILTEFGKQIGGQTRNNPKFGEFIVWPENFTLNNKNHESPILDSIGKFIENSMPKLDTIMEEFGLKEKSKLINATAIGKHFDISSQRLNLIFSEIGWIKKDISGWQITKLGKGLGGRQFEHETSGGNYVLWPENILANYNLVTAIKGTSQTVEPQKTTTDKTLNKNTSDNFREKFPATFRTKDGHMVRSRAEVIIDNALYDYKLVHAYERKLPIEEELYSDFFIPTENVYIEFWGMEDDPKYAERKKIKLEIYKKYDFKLIELNDSDISNLDDHLPKKLLKFNIKVY
jgi:hypothetical protein